MTAFGKTVNQMAAIARLMKAFETILSRFENPGRIHDPFFISELIAEYGPEIVKFIPTSYDTIFMQYIAVIDRNCLTEIKEIM